MYRAMAQAAALYAPWALLLTHEEMKPERGHQTWFPNLRHAGRESTIDI